MSNKEEDVSFIEDEISYLSQRYELRNSRDIIYWGIRTLYDLSKLDDNGWIFSIAKADISNEKQLKISQDYIRPYFKIDWIAPDSHSDIQPRLPSAEICEKIYKINK